MRLLSYLLICGLGFAQWSYGVIDPLFVLCVKQLEKEGVDSFVEQLANVGEQRAFEMVCTSLLKSDVFTVLEKNELVSKLSATDMDVDNQSYTSDIEMASSCESLKYEINTHAIFYHPSYKRFMSMLNLMCSNKDRITVNTPCFDDKRLLHLVVSDQHLTEENKISLIKLLLTMGANCKAIDIHGETALHEAVRMLSIDCVKVLLHSAHALEILNMGNAKKHTPLHVLLERCLQADINELKSHLSIIKEIIALFSAANVDIYLKNNNNIAPIDIAMAVDQKHNQRFKDLLLSNIKKS